jgi:hypothetical protein
MDNFAAIQCDLCDCVFVTMRNNVCDFSLSAWPSFECMQRQREEEGRREEDQYLEKAEEGEKAF